MHVDPEQVLQVLPLCCRQGRVDPWVEVEDVPGVFLQGSEEDVLQGGPGRNVHKAGVVEDEGLEKVEFARACGERGERKQHWDA